jgi:hypothetical protein
LPRALMEILEGRELLSTSLSPWQVTLAPSASARHAHHVHHMNHLRHLRHMAGVSRAVAPNAVSNAAFTAAAAAAAAPILRPDHIVVVIEEDRASDAIGDMAHMPYFNQLAAAGLVYTNSHGVAHPSLPDYLALYSGSTQGITDNGNNHTFTAPNLAKSLNSTLLSSGQYLSFAGYAESLPRDGDTTTRIAGDPNDPTAPPDLYMRNYNPMAQFTDVGAHGATAITNAQVNKTFASFPTTTAGYANLPTVSFIIPNSLHNTHGSNEQAPYATDPSEYNFLRSNADTWLKAKLDGYVQWAKANNSILIITTDEEETDSTPTSDLTTIVIGDPRLVVPGVNDTSFNHYNVLRTIEDMYGLAPLGNTATAAPLTTNALGQLSYPGQVTNQADTTTTLASDTPSPIWGQSITFTATVAPASPSSAVPSGAVTFMDGTTTLGSGVLNSAGQATFTTTALSISSHSITAIYNGDADFKTSTSPVLTQIVNPGPSVATATSLTSSANPSAFGQSITFTATVTSSAATPTGAVQFVIDGVNTGSPIQLIAGKATSPAIATLTSGVHAISALYSGAPGFAASTSPALTQTIGQVNDKFATRTVLSGTSITATGANLGATKETGEPNHAGNVGGKSLWYTWTAPSSGKVTIDTAGSTFDTLLAVYTGSSVSALTAVTGGANNDDPAGGTLTSKATFSVTAGAAYQIAVDGFNGAAGNIALHLNLAPNAPAAPTAVAASDGAFADRVRVTWTAPAGATAYEVWRNTSNSTTSAVTISAADITGTTYDDTTAIAGTTYYYWVKAKNAGGTSGFSASNTGFRALAALVNDNFANRTPITGTSATLTATNKGATKEAGEPNHAGNVGGKSVWYTWTAPASGKLTLDTTGSNFDTLLAVYTGASVSTLTAVPGGANDDNPAGGTTTSKVTINVTAGTTYQIAIDGYNGVYGNITLHLNLV